MTPNLPMLVSRSVFISCYSLIRVFIADNILIHYQKSNGIVALVVADDEAGRRMPFAFLAELHKQVSLICQKDLQILNQILLSFLLHLTSMKLMMHRHMVWLHSQRTLQN